MAAAIDAAKIHCRQLQSQLLSVAARRTRGAKVAATKLHQRAKNDPTRITAQSRATRCHHRRVCRRRLFSTQRGGGGALSRRAKMRGWFGVRGASAHCGEHFRRHNDSRARAVTRAARRRARGGRDAGSATPRSAPRGVVDAPVAARPVAASSSSPRTCFLSVAAPASIPSSPAPGRSSSPVRYMRACCCGAPRGRAGRRSAVSDR